MHPLTILMTNTWLAGRGGTELYVRDLAFALKRKGHRPLVYSPVLGEVADEIRSGGIEISDQWASFPADIDLIHGQHHMETLAALMFYPNTPAIFICHGFRPWDEKPPRFPRIMKYCVVDEATRERVIQETGLRQEQIEMVSNFVDLDRFHLKSDVSENPRRALVFHSMATSTQITPVIQAACQRLNLTVNLVGYRANNPCKDPENLLPQYDVVFAGGRSALEAMSCGCAVILIGPGGSGPLVTPANFDELRRWNFGFRTATTPFHPDALVQEIQSYRKDAIQAVTERVRREAGLERATAQWETIYQKALESARPLQAKGWDRVSEQHAIADYLRSLSLHNKENLASLAQSEQKIAELEKQVAHYSTLRVVRWRNQIRRWLVPQPSRTVIKNEREGSAKASMKQ